MAETVGQHSVAAFTSPVNGTTPIDANTVRGNDNTVRSAYVDHDADPGIHVQSSTLASRPVAGTAGRKWITVSSGRYQLWYDDGSRWHEVASDAVNVDCLADTALTKGDVIKITGFNNGQNLPTVAKVSASTDTAFGLVENTVSSGAIVQIINTGLIEDVDTNGYAVGTVLYPNTSGGWTTTKPTSGNYQPAGYVLRGNTNTGVLYVEFSAPRIVERSDNTASTIVLRDASGNFAAGTITAGALTSTGLVTFASLKGTGATTVTNILDEDNMASDSATALATQQSIKAYVDAKVATVDTLAEVLANGNTTGANNIIVSTGQKIQTPTIAAFDNTTAISIANTTGALTLASALADSNLATISTAGKVANSATTATALNTSSAIVARDSSGNFAAGTITANLTGNISGTAPAGTLTGTTLASNVVSSSLTSVGTLSSLTVSGDLTVDTSTLKVDSTNNRVGIGTATPTAGYALDVFSATDYVGATIRNSGHSLLSIQSAASARQALAEFKSASRTYTIGLQTDNTFSVYDNTAAATRLSLDTSGNLAVDTNTLYVDATNNRVGIGTTSPAQTLDVSGTFAVSGTTTIGQEVLRSSDTSYVRISGGNGAGTGANIIAFGESHATVPGQLSLSARGAGNMVHTIATGAYIWNAGSVTTERMRITSAGNVGIGTSSPGATLDVNGTARLSNGTGFTSSNALVRQMESVAGSANQFTIGSIGFLTGSFTDQGQIVFSTNNSSGNTERMRLDASGNLGLGVTPQTGWSANRTTFQVHGTVQPNILFTGNPTNGGAIWTNAYYDGANNKYIANGAASIFSTASGAFQWYTAASGTAGNNATFTQAMTLDASDRGILTVGPNGSVGSIGTGYATIGAWNTNGGGFRIVRGTGSGTATSVFYGDSTGTFFGSQESTPLVFWTNSTERARITSGGDFLVGTTSTAIDANKVFIQPNLTEGGRVTVVGNNSSAGALFLGGRSDTGSSVVLIRPDGDLENANNSYGSISDARLKQDIVDAASQWDDIKNLRVRKFRFKSDPDAPLQIGLIAQETEAVSPGLVKDTPDYEEVQSVDEDGNVTSEQVSVGSTKSVKYSVLYMKSVKALQEAMARIEALEARLEALEA